MRKFVIAAINLFAALALLLSACGASTPAATTAAATTAAKAAETTAATTAKATTAAAAGAAKTDVLYWFPHGGSPDREDIEGSVAKFNEKYPEYNVTGEWIGSSGAGVGMTDALMTAIAGGTPPDVVLFDRFMVGQWAGEGLFTELTDYAKDSGLKGEMYYDFAWQEASLKGKLYAVPFDTDNRALFYNKRLLDEAGISPPKTIAELTEAIDKLTIMEGPRFIQIGMVPWFGQGFLYTWAGAFGAQFQDADGRITFDDPKAIEALEWMVSIAKKYGMEAITEFATAANAGDLNPFRGEKFAMVISGPWEVAGIKKSVPDLQYGITSVPTPDGSVARTMAGGWSHIVPKGAKNPEGGFRFAKFMSVEEGGVSYGENTTHFMCSIEINNNLSWVKSNPLFKVFIDGFPHSFCRPVIAKGQLLWDEQLSAQNNALNGVDTPANLLKALTEKVNKELGY